MKLFAIFATLAVLAADAPKNQMIFGPETAPLLRAVSIDANKVAHINFDKAIAEDTVADWVNQIQEANEQGAVEIQITINSPGGSVFDGIELAHALEDSKVPTVCTVRGVAASMASYVLQSCAVRQMTKDSSIMNHEPSITPGGRLMPKDVEQIQAELRIIAKMISEHICARSKLTVDQFLKKIDGKELWTSWEDSLKYGFIDNVVPASNVKN